MSENMVMCSLLSHNFGLSYAENSGKAQNSRSFYEQEHDTTQKGICIAQRSWEIRHMVGADKKIKKRRKRDDYSSSDEGAGTYKKNKK